MSKQRMIVVGDSTFSGNIPEGASVNIISVKDGVAEIDDGRAQDLIMVSDLRPDLKNKICSFCTNEFEVKDFTIEKGEIVVSEICDVCSFWMKTFQDIRFPDSRDKRIRDIWITTEFGIYYCTELEEVEYSYLIGEGTSMVATKEDGTTVKEQNVAFVGVLPEEWRREIYPNTKTVDVVNG